MQKLLSVENNCGSQCAAGNSKHVNNESTVNLLIPPGSFCQTAPLAGEETAAVVSTERHLVSVPLPSRLKVVFTTHHSNSTFFPQFCMFFSIISAF